MKLSLAFIFLLLLVLTPFVSADFGYDNPSIPKLVPTPTEIRINQTIITQTIINNINQFDQSLNTTDNVQFQNLTLEKQITFAFGEIIDNIVNGWIRITGSLNVTGNLFVTQNITLSNGGVLHGNATCTFLTSPDGSSRLEVCNA